MQDFSQNYQVGGPSQAALIFRYMV